MTTLGQIRGPLLVFLGALCFSTSGFLQAVAPEGATPFVVACARMLIGAGALFAYNLLRGKALGFRNWPWKSVWVYAVALWLFQITFFYSVLKVGVAVGTVVSIGATPIFSGLIAWLFQGARPPKAWYPATLVAALGLVLINAVDGVGFQWYDLLLPLFAGACYAVEICVSKPLTEHHSAEESMMLVMGMVGVGLLPLALFQPLGWIVSPQGAAVVLGLGVVTAACAFSLMVAGIKTTPAPVASTLALGEPMGAALLGIIALGEPYTWQTLLGIACIFASIVFLIVGEARAAKKAGAKA